MRALLAGSVVLLLALGFTVPAESGDGLAEAWRVASDGSAELVEGRVLDLAPPSMPTMQTRQAPQEPDVGPDPGDLSSEKQRPTRLVTLYGHVFGLGLIPGARGDGEFGPAGPQPANTIYPHGDANLGLGFFDWCSDAGSFQGIPPEPSPWGGCDGDPNNKIGLFLTAGPVQVHTPDEFVYSKLHNERGRTKDIVLDTAGEVKAWLWMSLDYHSWSVGNGQDDTFCPVGLPPDVGCPYPYWGWDPAVWPQWVVEAKLYMVELGEYGQGASEPPPIYESWAGGSMTLIAEGATQPEDVTNGLPGNPNVHEFEVSLGRPKVELIPKTHDVVLVYSFYSLLNGQKVAVHSWRVWAGELFPAKFTLPLKNPLDVELVIPQFVHDKLLIHGVIASAFGSYDVNVASAKLTVLGPGNQPVEPRTLSRVGDYQVAHGAHFKPVNVTWIWDYRADGLKPGSYKVLVEACNQQGSACEVTEAAFTIDEQLQPTDIRVGRSGQRTVSEEQLEEITSGQASTQALDEAQAEPQAPPPSRRTPGFEAAGLALAGGLALAVRRRWER